MEDKKSASYKFGLVCFCVLLVPIAAIYSAYILHYMWGWFVVPMGLNHITMAHCYGLALMASFACTSYKSESTDKGCYFGCGDN
jgi:hypothetical protein